jgi:LmbE family N-acetylglucosaminyl deacetylase
MHSTSALRGQVVLALHAHPDDEAIFTGLTLRRLADAGARVVLVLATRGELGSSRLPLAPGETVARRRVAELERSAALLGVQRLVLLGGRDSGLPGWPSGSHPNALAGADADALGRRVADLAAAESAGTLIFDDDGGVYGHPDHQAAHRIGAVAARLTGAASYCATVDHEHLGTPAAGEHLVHQAAAAAAVGFGRPAGEIALAVTGSAGQLAGKRAAMTAHASQIDPGQLPVEDFAATYGTEWYRRHSGLGALELLAPADHRADRALVGS